MKAILIIILLFAFAVPCFAELTENDMRRIIREEIEIMKKDIKDDMKALENRMGQLENRVAAIEAKMATKDDIITINQKFDDKINSLYQKLSNKIDSLYTITITALVTLIVVIAVPQIIIMYRERRESRLSKEVDELKQEIAELKGKMIISP